MRRRSKLPSHREALLLGLLVKKSEMFGLQIRDEYCLRFGLVPLGSLYTTLDRMVENKLVDTRLGDGTVERGGHRKKYFKITAQGKSALQAYEQQISLFQTLRGAFGRMTGLGEGLET